MILDIIKETAMFSVQNSRNVEIKVRVLSVKKIGVFNVK
jgi:hypothetical protein